MKKYLLTAIFCLLPIASFAQPSHTVTLTWAWSQGTGGSGTGFNVKRATITGGPYVIIGSIAITTLTYVDTSTVSNLLIEGQKYYYVITATGPGGESIPSNEANALIPFSTPAIPITLQAIPK